MRCKQSKPNKEKIISDWLEKLVGKSIRTKTVRAFQKQHDGPDITIEFVRGDVTSSIINEGAGPSQLVLLLAILATAKNNSVIASFPDWASRWVSSHNNKKVPIQ